MKILPKQLAPEFIKQWMDVPSETMQICKVFAQSAGVYVPEEHALAGLCIELFARSEMVSTDFRWTMADGLCDSE
jgi:hypothetical protein